MRFVADTGSRLTDQEGRGLESSHDDIGQQNSNCHVSCRLKPCGAVADDQCVCRLVFAARGTSLAAIPISGGAADSGRVVGVFGGNDVAEPATSGDGGRDGSATVVPRGGDGLRRRDSVRVEGGLLGGLSRNERPRAADGDRSEDAALDDDSVSLVDDWLVVAADAAAGDVCPYSGRRQL